MALGMRGSATCDFDNMLIYTEGFPTGSVVNPPVVPPPTSTAGVADVAVNSYASPPFYYHLNDHLGSTRILTNASGAVTGSFEYYPFGELKSSTGCAADNQKFTGKLFDNESGLQYFGARYLSNDLTRFTSVDPAAASFDPFNPQSWNRYTYALNDPLSLSDPNGLAPEPQIEPPPQRVPPPAAPTPRPIPSPTPTPNQGSGKAAELLGRTATGAVLRTPPALIAALLIILFPSDISPDDGEYELAKGDKSYGEYIKHIKDLEEGKKELERLKKEREKATGPKSRKPIDAEIEKAKERIKRHEKEVRQKWPDGAPEQKD